MTKLETFLEAQARQPTEGCAYSTECTKQRR